VSSKIDHETGIVTISAPSYATMPPGHQLYVCGIPGVLHAIGCRRRDFDDYFARLALSRPSNGVRVNEVRIKPPEEALLEALTNGTVHESLVEEPAA
jgi:hypothetical protein